MGTAGATLTRSGSIISAKVAFNVFLLLLVAGASLVAAAQDEDDNNNNASSVAVTEASSPAGAGGEDVGTERVGGDKGLGEGNDSVSPTVRNARGSPPEGCSYIPSTVKAPENARRRVLLEAIVDDEDEEEEEEEEEEAERRRRQRSRVGTITHVRARIEAVLDETDAEVHGEGRRRSSREAEQAGAGGCYSGPAAAAARAVAGGTSRHARSPQRARRGRPRSPPSEELTAGDGGAAALEEMDGPTVRVVDQTLHPGLPEAERQHRAEHHAVGTTRDIR